MPNKRKQAALVKRYQRQAAAVCLRGIGVAFVTGNDKVDCIHLKTAKPIKPPAVLGHALSDVPHKWTVLISVMLEGGKYHHEQITMAVKYKQSSLVEYLNEQHQAMLRRLEKEDVWCAGWVACPYDFNIDNRLADSIYTNIGAWQKQGE